MSKKIAVIFPILFGCALLGVAVVAPSMSPIIILLALPWFAVAGFILISEA